METGWEWCHCCCMEFAYLAKDKQSLIKCPFCGEVMLQCNMCTDRTCANCVSSKVNPKEKRERFREYSSFAGDEEKMFDFIALSKDEFLESYSYLTEEEYYITATEVLSVVRNYRKTIKE